MRKKNNIKAIIIMTGDTGQTEYREIYDVGLKDGALLHRYVQNNGSQYSAIYQNNVEQIRCKISQEDRMISGWNNI